MYITENFAGTMVKDPKVGIFFSYPDHGSTLIEGRRLTCKILFKRDTLGNLLNWFASDLASTEISMIKFCNFCPDIKLSYIYVHKWATFLSLLITILARPFGMEIYWSGFIEHLWENLKICNTYHCYVMLEKKENLSQKVWFENKYPT